MSLLRKVGDDVLLHENSKNTTYQNLYDAMVKIFWTKDDISLSQDVTDYKILDEEGKKIITEVFKIFTTSDRNVATSYSVLNANHLVDGDINKCLSVCNYVETIHEENYALLLDELGFDEDFHSEVLNTPLYVKKFKLLADSKPKQYWNYPTQKEHAEAVMRYIYITSALTEGISLFSQFSILLFFSRSGLFSAMSTINEYSLVDESLHIEVMSNIYKDLGETYLTPEEYEAINRSLETLTTDHIIYQEYDFAELVIPEKGYAINDKITLNLDDHYVYVEFLVDYRMHQFLGTPFANQSNPYDWLDAMISSSAYHDFFATDVTGYTVGTDTAKWKEYKEKLRRKLKKGEENV